MSDAPPPETATPPEEFFYGPMCECGHLRSKHRDGSGFCMARMDDDPESRAPTYCACDAFFAKSAPPASLATPPETIRCASCGLECEPVNDSDQPVTICVRCGDEQDARDARRYRALHPYLRGCMEYDERGHVLRLGERTIPTLVRDAGWTGELIDLAADYAVAVKAGIAAATTRHQEGRDNGR